MAPVSFNWDDLARAGDKIPESEDDKKCGDHYIPKWKDCHDGEAHRPEPGQNPYWTDENSAEERRDRDVPHDTNKPKSREERDKETEWEEPKKDDPDSGTLDPADEFEETPEQEPEETPEQEPEEEAPKDDHYTDEEMGPPDESQLPPDDLEPPAYDEPVDGREAQRQATVEKWAQKDAQLQQNRENLRPKDLTPGALKKYRNKLRRSIDHVANMCTLANMGNYQYPDSQRPSPGERAEEWMDVRTNLQRWREFQPQNQEDVDKIADVLRGVLRNLDIAVGEELRQGRMWNQGFTQPSNGWGFDPKAREMWQAEDLLDRYETDKYTAEQPQDLLAWEKFRRDPESMKSVTEIPGFRFKEVDPENMTPEQERLVGKKVAQLDLMFKMWQRNPRSGHGVELAKNLMGGTIYSNEPHLPRTIESPLEPNYEAARIIAEKSAKYGSEVANDFMWEEFGVSEEWTSESFVHDYSKAAQKAIRAAKAELNLDIPAFIKESKALEKLERGVKSAKKRYDETFRQWFQKKRDLRTQRDNGLIDDITFQNAHNELTELGPTLSDEYDRAREIKGQAEQAMNENADKARENLVFSLTLANRETQAQPETVTAILSRLDQPVWRDHSQDKPAADKRGKVSRKEKIAFDELMRHRQQARQRYPGAGLTQADLVKDTMTRVIGYLHRDLLEGPEGHHLRELKWQTEVMWRANADKANNAINLDQNTFPGTAAHEFGHHLEFRNPRVRARILDFYNERTEGVPSKRIKSYERHELFKNPRSQGKRFFHEYAAKVYLDPVTGEQSDTELLSMGLEALEHRGKFRALLRNDPEHLAIILATIRGY